VAALVRFETDGEVCPHGPLVAIEDQLRPAELDLRVTYVIVELTRAQAVA
jgi:hypothetical protein